MCLHVYFVRYAVSIGVYMNTAEGRGMELVCVSEVRTESIHSAVSVPGFLPTWSPFSPLE